MASGNFFEELGGLGRVPCQQRMDVVGAAVARLGDQREVGRRALAGIDDRNQVCGRWRTFGHIARHRVLFADLALPVLGDRLHLGVFVAEIA